ncbi:MAG: acid shock protein [Oscillospiraceae bacterium]|nr:acid shock protein [Oscillospiraceae bacterium]
MKKLLCLLLTAAMILSCAACGTLQETAETPAPAVETEPEPTPSAPETTAEPKAAGPFSPEGDLIFEHNGVKVSTAGLAFDPMYEGYVPIVWIDIENAGSQDVWLGVTFGSVNGVMTGVRMNEYYMEDGECYGGSEDFGTAVPAGETVRRALGYSKQEAPGIHMDSLDEMELCFTLAPDEWTAPTYVSEPVIISTGELFDLPDIAGLGTVVLDNDVLTLVLGEQDYEDWSGPVVYVYVENKSDRCIGLFPESSVTDGVACDYLYGGFQAAPGKLAVGSVMFDGEARELKGFEELSMTFSLGVAETGSDLYNMEFTTLEPVSVKYPPQVWGEYENGGLRMELQPKYNGLVTVETPENDENGVLFSVSETASLQAGGEGMGWLFSVCRISEEELHELLCFDMSGMEIFAKDGDGNHYLFCRPTDVRYARATTEEMQRDAETWSMLCEWADSMKDTLSNANELEWESFDTYSYPAMLIARAAWEKGVTSYLATTEYMDADAKAVDGTPFAEYVLHGGFWEIGREELPDDDYLTGENLVLGFPDEDVHLHFYPVDGGYVILDDGENETIYQGWGNDDGISVYEAMLGWYYAAAEKSGVKPADESLTPFLGQWHEKIAGRGTITVARSPAPGKVKISVEWPDSAAVHSTWTMIAALTEDGKLVYENGTFETVETDENGESWVIDSDWGLTGELSFSGDGELCWYDAHAEGDGLSTFVR